MDALLDAAGLNSSDEDERMQMNDVDRSQNDAGSTQTSRTNTRTSILDENPLNDLPQSQGSSKSDGSLPERVVTWELPAKPTLSRCEIAYTPRSAQSTLFKAAEEHKASAEYNADLVVEVWEALQQAVKLGKKQEGILKKAQKTASSARDYKHEARGAKAELATSKDAWKVERSSFTTQIATLKEAKKNADETLKDMKER